MKIILVVFLFYLLFSNVVSAVNIGKTYENG